MNSNGNLKFYQVSDIDLYDIKLSKAFQNELPRMHKLAKVINYYKFHKKLDKPLVINQNGELIDNYTRYLVAKMLEIHDCDIVCQIGEKING